MTLGSRTVVKQLPEGGPVETLAFEAPDAPEIANRLPSLTQLQRIRLVGNFLSKRLTEGDAEGLQAAFATFPDLAYPNHIFGIRGTLLDHAADWGDIAAIKVLLAQPGTRFTTHTPASTLGIPVALGNVAATELLLNDSRTTLSHVRAAMTLAQQTGNAQISAILERALQARVSPPMQS